MTETTATPNPESTAPFKANEWREPQVTVKTLESGELRVIPAHPLKAEADTNLVAQLADVAAEFPDRVFLAQRGGDDQWRKITYREADQITAAIAQGLINLGCQAGERAMILSENSLEHGLFMLAALKAQLVVVPVSPGYSLLSQDHQKVRRIYEQTEPAVVFVQDADRYARVIAALDLASQPLVLVNGGAPGDQSLTFESLASTPITEAVAESCAQITPDTIAKILFTSGSTGEPKGVLNNHRNLCFVHRSLASVVTIDKYTNPPIFLDWLPWHHTFGGNQNFNRIIRYAGTLYLDDGKPLPGEFAKTLRNLKEIPVTTYSTVPAVYPMLLDALEKDAELRQMFFSKLNWLAYGGSDMPQSTYDRIQKIAVAETGHRYPLIAGMGSTETCSTVSVVHWNNEEMGNIGLPVPGTELKLIPVGDKFEMRVKGPQVMPGYYQQPEKNAESFDADGFFKTGDAVRWIDPNDPNKGLKFAGRVSEDFKLLNGTWVHTGALRNALVSALSPLISDLVVCGQDKEFLSIMAWPNEAGVRKLLSEPEANLGELLAGEAFRQLLRERLEQFNGVHKQSSMRIRRALILQEPPSLDANEITDKRYINQRAVLDRRADQVERLYQAQPDDGVICV